MMMEAGDLEPCRFAGGGIDVARDALMLVALSLRCRTVSRLLPTNPMILVRLRQAIGLRCAKSFANSGPRGCRVFPKSGVPEP